MGSHTKHGKYTIEPERVRQWIVPDLTHCQLKPYVSHKTPKTEEKPLTPQSFLASRSGEAMAPPKEVLDRPPVRIPNIVKRMTEECMKNPKIGPFPANKHTT